MGIYVHIPFCEKKCYYCDFHSVVVGDLTHFAKVTDDYLISVRKEALYYKKQWGNKSLSTLFIGGGTPTSLPPQKLASLIRFILHEFPFAENPEVTIEANPHTIHLNDAKILASAGVNRVSIGAQSFQNNLLQSMGRLHRSDQIEKSVLRFKEAGIDNVNLDIMFGLPEQTINDWKDTLMSALSLKPTHLSCYGLILEPGTPFAIWEAKGILRFPTDDDQAEMFEIAREVLVKSGYEHYEISNFCKPRFEARHNLLYWMNMPFIGLGSGATGYLNRRRYTNIAKISEYIKGWMNDCPIYERESLISEKQEMDETMMVGMRLLQGVSEIDFMERYGMSFFEVYPLEIEGLLNKGLVELVNGKLRVTKQGLYLENMVSGAFLP